LPGTHCCKCSVLALLHRHPADSFAAAQLAEAIVDAVFAVVVLTIADLFRTGVDVLVGIIAIVTAAFVAEVSVSVIVRAAALQV
jgi:hypothetical protein